MKLSWKFGLTVVAVLVVSLGATTHFLIRRQERTLLAEATVRAKAVLSFGEACREYARETLSPAVRKHTKDLVFEANSATFVARGTFDAFRKRMPEYSFREAALDPLNLANRATPEEARLIASFRADPKLQELTGFTGQGAAERLFVSRPILVKKVCLDCHGSPDAAPREVVARYGREHGYGWKEGDVAAAIMVTVPTSDLRAQHAGTLRFIMGACAAVTLLLMVLIPLTFQALAGRRLDRISRAMERVAAGGDLSERLGGWSKDEIGRMCCVFDGMTEQLAQEKEKVASHARNLENLVAERTGHLNQALNKVRRLARAADAAADAIVMTDVEGKIVWVNPAFRAITGYAPEEAIGRRPSFLKSGLHPREFYAAMWGEILAGKSWSGRLVNRRRNGTLYHAEQTIAPVLGGGGIEGFVAVHRDISTEVQREQERAYLQRQIQAKAALLEEQNRELAAARLQAEAATRAKSVFLANMSHEIRTPMNAVLGMTGLLLETDLDGEQREFVHTIRMSGDSLLTIINDILDLSKIEAGKLDLEVRPFDLRDLVERSLDLVAPRAAEKGLDLACLIDERTPGVFYGDVTRVGQILVNLLGNAVKFTTAGEAVIAVEARPLGDGRGRPAESRAPGQDADGTGTDSAPLYEWRFAVRDTGIGIPSDRLERLFQSFSQVDASTTRQYGGTGLGLAISKLLVEMMGGRIWVESEAGKGSTFHFTLVAAGGPGEPRADRGDMEPRLSGKRLLIVDDNETNRRILVRQTGTWGMLPREAASGPEALELLRAGDPFDLAILDMQMPGMDGMTLAAEIRGLGDRAALPLVMLTSMGVRCEDARNADFAALLTKPIKASLLHDALMSACGGSSRTVRHRACGPVLDAGMGERLPLRILLAEDNAVNQKVAIRILERMGYRADAAANGLEVLAALARQPYDLVLMDVQMPGMDGLEATRRIRAQWSADHRPRIVAMTAGAMQEDREACLGAGMDDYVSKPIRFEELQAALARCAAARATAEAPGDPPPRPPGTQSPGAPVSTGPSDSKDESASLT